MKPAWNQLGDAFQNSKTVIIGDVDCTVEKDLCSKYGVRGYPTIKYFTGATAADGDKYEGGRDFDALKNFADENLGPSCSVDAKDLCSDEQLAIINEAEALSLEDINKYIEGKEKDISDAEKLFKDELAKLQARYEQLQKDKDATIKEASAPLRYYRSVLNAASESGDSSHDEL
jgi:protein disulfide-isomerase A6